MLPVLHLLEKSQFPPVERRNIRTVQVNLGYRCNQSCLHCHVNAGPKRTEEMSADTVNEVIALLAANPGITTLDMTGGAPELNPHFRRLVMAARQLGKTVIDRCNLTILSEPGMEWLADFLAEQRVEIVASLSWPNNASRSSRLCRAILKTTSIANAEKVVSPPASTA